MKIKNNNNININSNKKFFMENKNNLKLLDSNYYSRKNEPSIQISYENKSKKKKIKPPFKQGLYSYKQSFNTLQNDYNKNLLNNNFFSNNSPNKNLLKKENNIFNINNIMPQGGGGNMTNNNSSLSFSSINLNKYKINTNPNQKNNNIKFNNLNINNNIYNNKVYNSSNINNIKNTNASLNLNNINNNTNNISTNNNNNISKKIYQNNFSENLKYEKESRRMIIEYIKILNNNTNDTIKQTILDNNISLKVLNQRYNDVENNYSNNHELFGEAKKQLYLKNLNYSLSYDSFRSNTNEEKSSNKNNNILPVNNYNNILFNKENKKINILNFLCVPRILNLIEEDGSTQKYIFLIVLDEIYFKEGKESYHFQWRDMSTYEVENEFNLKEVKSCKVSKKYKNRLIIEVEKEDLNENINFEIEAPSEEICNNYVIGINYFQK